MWNTAWDNSQGAGKVAFCPKSACAVIKQSSGIAKEAKMSTTVQQTTLNRAVTNLFCAGVLSLLGNNWPPSNNRQPDFVRQRGIEATIKEADCYSELPR